MSDSISRQAAIDALFELYEYQRAFDPTEAADLVRQGIYLAEKKIEQLPSAQPNTSNALESQEILGWLLAYHTKSFELKGTYKPHEVISWLINDISRTLFEGTEE